MKCRPFQPSPFILQTIIKKKLIITLIFNHFVSFRFPVSHWYYRLTFASHPLFLFNSIDTWLNRPSEVKERTLRCSCQKDALFTPLLGWGLTLSKALHRRLGEENVRELGNRTRTRPVLLGMRVVLLWRSNHRHHFSESVAHFYATKVVTALGIKSRYRCLTLEVEGNSPSDALESFTP